MQEDVLAADKATDVWACGTVLFAMLTAQPPSHTSGTQERSSGGATEAAAEDDAAAGKLVWPDNVQVSDACKNLLEVMLSPHPAERPTIRQVLDHPWCDPFICLHAYAMTLLTMLNMKHALNKLVYCAYCTVPLMPRLKRVQSQLLIRQFLQVYSRLAQGVTRQRKGPGALSGKEVPATS